MDSDVASQASVQAEAAPAEPARQRLQQPTGKTKPRGVALAIAATLLAASLLAINHRGQGPFEGPRYVVGPLRFTLVSAPPREANGGLVAPTVLLTSNDFQLPAPGERNPFCSPEVLDAPAKAAGAVPRLILAEYQAPSAGSAVPTRVRLGDIYPASPETGDRFLCAAVFDYGIDFGPVSADADFPSPVQQQPPPREPELIEPRILAAAMANGVLAAAVESKGRLTLATDIARPGVWRLSPEAFATALLATARTARAHAPLMDVAVFAPVVGLEEAALPARPVGAWLADLFYMLETPLPWPRQAAALQAAGAEAGVRPDGTLDPAVLNPILESPPRGTYLPAVLYVAAFLGLLAHRLRRRPPERTAAYWCAIYAALVPLPILLLFVLRWHWAWWPEALVDPEGAFSLWGHLPLLALGAVSVLAGGTAGVWADRYGRAARRTDAATGPATQAVETLRTTLHRDTPVEDIAQDRLDFAPLVKALVRFLDNRDTLPPVVLAINGPWGSGKSSIMKMLRSELEKTTRFRTAWFNAWQYHDQEKILAAFLKRIGDDLTRDVGLLFWPRLAWARLREATLPQLVLLGLLPLLVVLSLARPDLIPLIGDSVQKLGGEGSAWADALASVFSLGWVAVLLRYLQPFRSQYGSLVALRDYNKELGALSDFERDFRHYRAAVDREKFLICIDDLDRCAPDKVVEVLKTINLIVTSQEGAGRTFFVLGFDPRYITRSVELHFKELAKAGDLLPGRFGQQYLKKMVTLSVSVPTPSRDRLRALVEQLEAERAAAARARPPQTLAGRLRDAFAANGRWLAAAVVLAGLCVALILATPGPPGPAPVPADPTAATTGGAAGTQPGGAAAGAMLPPPPAEDAPWPTWVALGLLVVAGGFVTARVWRWLRQRASVPPEPGDPPALQAALTLLADLLPQNPRDTIRLVNAIRATYLLQVQGVAAAPDAPPLEAGDCVLYTLLQHLAPDFFDPDTIEGKVVPAVAGSAGPLEARLAALRQAVPQAGLLLAALGRIKDAPRDLAQPLVDAGKLLRFVALNRFLLDVTFEPEPGAEAKPA